MKIRLMKTMLRFNLCEMRFRLWGKEAEELQQEIVDANAEIEAKKEQTKSLIEYLQLSQGENVYLEYAFGAETVTDLIYRLSVVEQIAEYNDNMVAELETMIQENEDRKVELANRQEEYEQKWSN